MKTILTIAICAAAIASGYSSDSYAAAPKPAKIELGVGIVALRVPDYPGADQSTNYVLPVPFMVYRGERIRASRRGISGRLYSTETAEIDFGLAGSLPVNSEDNDARRNMNDLDITGEFGPRLKLRLFERGNDDLWLHLPLRAMSSTDFRSIRYQGWNFAPGLRYIKRLPKQTFIKVKLETGYASSGFHDYFYGVKSNEVIAGEREAYQGKSGYTGSRFGVGFARWWDNWRAFAGLSITNVDGSAYQDSPLVQQANGLTFSAGFTWTFFRSEATAYDVLDSEI
jgi:outer membrane protein